MLLVYSPCCADDIQSAVTRRFTGVGLAIAKKVAETPGTLCVLTSRDPGRGEKAVESLQKEGLDLVYKQLDIGDPESIEVCFFYVLKQQPCLCALCGT